MNAITIAFIIGVISIICIGIWLRKGTWTKPNTDKQGKHFVSNEGKHCFVYWDLDATPNDNGNQWRMATDPMRVRI